MASHWALSFATLNVRGLASRKKQAQVYRLLIDQDIDVLAVQETKVEGEEETRSMMLRFTSKYYGTVSHANGTSAGCVLFVKKIPGLIVESHFSCDSGRTVTCDFSTSEIEWRVICVYAPNVEADRETFFSLIKQHLRTPKQLVLLVDFNCVLSAKDRINNRHVRDRSVEVLYDLLNESDLDDVAECLEAGREVRFTHFQGTSHARLDRIYMAGETLAKSNSYTVLPVSFSDHCLVQCNVGLKQKENKFSWDLWKFNAKLFRDAIFNNFVIQ